MERLGAGRRVGPIPGPYATGYFLLGSALTLFVGPRSLFSDARFLSELGRARAACDSVLR